MRGGDCCRPLCATITCVNVNETHSGCRIQRKVVWEELIINQSWKYKWETHTTVHMVMGWPDQLMVGAQMEQMGLLP